METENVVEENTFFVKLSTLNCLYIKWLIPNKSAKNVFQTCLIKKWSVINLQIRRKKKQKKNVKCKIL